jgi:hypothetical protein
MTDRPTPLDQVEALHAMTGIATLVHGYYTSAVEAGFSEAEAMVLAIAWQHAAMGAPFYGTTTGGSDS